MSDQPPAIGQARSIENGIVFAGFLALFFLSGFAALVYQVIWHRILSLFSGTDVGSTTMIVAAYMAGLGLGSLAGGELADRVGPRARILWFAAAELAVAGFAAGSDWLYYDLLHHRYGQLASSPVTLAAILVTSFLWPTFFMGLSLPLLARSLSGRIESAAARIAALYAVNTLGAATGAFVAAWYFLRTRDFAETLDAGAFCNVVIAVGSILLGWRAARRGEDHPSDSEATAAPTAPVETSSLGFRAWMAVFALAGFVALSWEIVWFRLLGVVLKSSAFTFPTLLTIYLAGLAFGTAGGIVWARRTRRPARAYFAAQWLATLYIGLAVPIGLGRIRKPVSDTLWGYLGSYEPIDLTIEMAALVRWIQDAGPPPLSLILLYGVVPAFLIGPPTLLMGASFPLLQRSVQTDARLVGRRVGWLQAANIAGSVLGTVAVGVLALEWLGTSRTSQALLALGSVFLFLWVRERWPKPSRRRGAVLAAGAALAAVLVLRVPGPAALWSTLHGSTPDLVISAEGSAGLSVLKNARADFTAATTVYANGIGQSELPFGGVHSQLGALPAMVHPDPRDVAVIGLGSGDTLFSAAGRPETRAVTCIEIVAPQHRTLELVRDRSGYAGVRALLSDPRVRFEFTDGRTFLRLGERLYDIIEADALRASSAYSGNLYSYEYFKMVQTRLKPGGFAVSWSASPRVYRTFMRAFPHVLGFRQVLIGSLEPIRFDLEVVRARIADPRIAGYYRRAGLELSSILEGVDKDVWVVTPDRDRSTFVDINRDLFPRDEYRVADRQ